MSRFRLLLSCLFMFLVRCNTQTIGDVALRPSTNDQCAFVQHSSMLELLESNWEDHNISDLVETCDSVCLLVYGAGNPDISGVGAMISYVIQGISTVLLGPVLASRFFIHDMRNPEGKDTFFQLDPTALQNLGPWATGIVRMARRHHHNNSFITLSIYVALLVQLNTRYIPVAELDFIKSLELFQFTIWILSFLGTAYFVAPEDSVGSRFSWRNEMSGLHMLLAYTISAYISFIKIPPGAETLVLRELTRLCHLRKQYPNPDSAFRRTPNGWPGPAFHAVFWPSFTVVVLAMGALVWYFARAVRRFFRSVSQRWSVFCCRAGLRPRKFAGCLMLFPLLLLFSFTCVLQLVLLEWRRLYLQQVTGDAYRDSEWGFGQVLAVLVWLPLAEECFVVVWGKSLSLF